jgi:hypothetical protein
VDIPAIILNIPLFSGRRSKCGVLWPNFISTRIAIEDNESAVDFANDIHIRDIGDRLNVL